MASIHMMAASSTRSAYIHSCTCYGSDLIARLLGTTSSPALLAPAFAYPHIWLSDQHTALHRPRHTVRRLPSLDRNQWRRRSIKSLRLATPQPQLAADIRGGCVPLQPLHALNVSRKTDEYLHHLLHSAGSPTSCGCQDKCGCFCYGRCKLH